MKNILFLHISSNRLNSAKLIRGDLGRDTQKTAQTIIDEALKGWGRLDLLVNNAVTVLRN